MGFFFSHPYLLTYSCYIPVHTLYTLPRKQADHAVVYNIWYYHTDYHLPPYTLRLGNWLCLCHYAPQHCLLFVVPYAPWSSNFPPTPEMADVPFFSACPSICRWGGGLITQTIESPNSCLLFPTSSSPDSASTAPCGGSRYSPLVTSSYGCSLGRILNLRGSTMSPDVVVVATVGNWDPGASLGECVFDPSYLSPLAVYGSIPIFLPPHHIPWVCGS